MLTITGVKRSLVERVRCAKHNWLDSARFRISFDRGSYVIHTDDGTTTRFPQNPYLAFRQIMEGYLEHGKISLSRGMFVMDAGACQGEFALYASQRVGSEGRVIVLEPDPLNLQALQAAFALNGGIPANVTVLECGLWSESATLRFASGQGASSSVMASDDSRPPESADKVIEISAQSIDNLVRLNRLPRLDLIKMDIEGAEIEAVHGATRTMATLKPRFTIASYHVRQAARTAELLKPLFEAHNYTARIGFPEHLTTYAELNPGPAASAGEEPWR